MRLEPLQLRGCEVDLAARQLGQPRRQDVDERAAARIGVLEIPDLGELAQRAGDEERLGVLVRRVAADAALDLAPVAEPERGLRQRRQVPFVAGFGRGRTKRGDDRLRDLARHQVRCHPQTQTTCAREERQQIDAVPAVSAGSRSTARDTWRSPA